jgi:hypothetical protein
MYRRTAEFKVYQPTTKLVKDERGDLLVNPQNIFNRWKNYVGQLLNSQGAGGVRQTKLHTAEPFVLQPSTSEVEAAIVMLVSYVSHQALITFKQYQFNEEGKHCSLRSTNLLC